MGHLVYLARGVLSLVTTAGSWIAPPNRAVWTPAHFAHQHRAHGDTDMREIFVPAVMAERLHASPAVLAVSALARVAALTLTGSAARGAQAKGNLRHVILDEIASAEEQPLHLPEPRDDRLREVTRLVEADLTASASLGDLGRRVGASQRTLSRLFRGETGMGFRQWRTQLRIHSSLLLLADGETVIDTATRCGWSNPTSFTEAFAHPVGRTPGQYKRELDLR